VLRDRSSGHARRVHLRRCPRRSSTKRIRGWLRGRRHVLCGARYAEVDARSSSDVVSTVLPAPAPCDGRHGSHVEYADVAADGRPHTLVKAMLTRYFVLLGALAAV